VQSISGPSVQAATLVSRGNPTGAIDVLQKASPYDNTNTVVLFLRATAHLKAYRASEAIREFDRIENLQGYYPQDPLLALAQLGLGRAHALTGSVSQTMYQTFFTEWKDADPDIPVLKQAKAEYAKLQ